MSTATIPAHHLEFVARNRLCVLSWHRSAPSGDGPPLTPVFYATEGNGVLISMTEDRAKTRALRRDPAISVCVLGEEMPFPYVTLFGTASIDTDPTAAFELMAKVVERMGRVLDDDARKALRERADRERRVVLRVTLQRSVSNLPAPT